MAPEARELHREGEQLEAESNCGEASQDGNWLDV
jgi:hypothetical protein